MENKKKDGSKSCVIMRDNGTEEEDCVNGKNQGPLIVLGPLIVPSSSKFNDNRRLRKKKPPDNFKTNAPAIL